MTSCSDLGEPQEPNEMGVETKPALRPLCFPQIRVLARRRLGGVANADRQREVPGLLGAGECKES